MRKVIDIHSVLSCHTESIVLLSKLHTKQNIEVELEMSELDLTAAESKTTYEEIKEYVQKQSGLKVSNLYIAQVSRNTGLLRAQIITCRNRKIPDSQSVR